MFKNITSNDKSLRPFKTYKQFTFNETDSGSGIFGLEGISGSTHNFVTSSALSQSYGAYKTGSFSVGTFYKSPIYFSTKHLYYQYDNVPNRISKNTRYPIYTAGNWTRKWPHGRPDLSWGNINPRKFHDKVNVVTVPRQFFGEEIKPGSVVLTDSSGDDTIELRDDGHGQLYDYVYSASFATGAASPVWYNLAYNGSVDRVDCGDIASFEFTDPFTVAAWIKASGSDTHNAIITKYDGGGKGWSLILTGGKVNFQSNDNIATGAQGTDLRNDGAWHLVHAVMESTLVSKMYVDGILVYTKTGTTWSPNPETGNSVQIGARDGIVPFRGWISQAAGWDVAFTQTQISAQYSESIASDWRTNYNTNLIGYWRLNNTTSITDLSGYANTGTLGGGLTASSALTSYESTGSVVGNVFYEHGLITITDTGSLYNSCSLGIGGSQAGQYGGSNGFTLKFQATHTSYEYEYMCNIDKFEYNSTTNPSIIIGRSGSIKVPNGAVYIMNDDVLNPDYDSVMDLVLPAATSSYQMSYNPGISYENFTTHSQWNPYITNIGLYNDANELLAIGKLSNPVKNDAELALTFAVRFDS